MTDKRDVQATVLCDIQYVLWRVCYCNDWILNELESSVQPHSCMPFAHVGLSIELHYFYEYIIYLYLIFKT